MYVKKTSCYISVYQLSYTRYSIIFTVLPLKLLGMVVINVSMYLICPLLSKCYKINRAEKNHKINFRIIF